MTSQSPRPLSPEQAQALFDILSHHQLASEITQFKYSDAIDQYGPPFQNDLAKRGKSSTSPTLQSLLQRFITCLPGLRKVSDDFWQKHCKNIVQKLADAELSESYDKGKIGSRRALATASAVVLEYPARGCLGGYAREGRGKQQADYDVSDADDVIRAWNDFCQKLVYDDLIDELFDRTAKSDKLEDHSQLVQAAHEYMLVNLASFLHFIMVHSPDGPYVARLTENVHKLVPYTMIRQTLKIGNAATMINSMVKLLLTKLSVSSITNWMGITNTADEGLNLMQNIVSTVIGWDISALQKQVAQVEKQEDAPGKRYRDAIREYLNKSRDEHDAMRNISEAEEKSIVAVIFENADLDVDALSEEQHAIAMQYLSLHLSIRDRERLSKIACSQQPDLLTEAIKEVVAAYDPIIRDIHSAYDLSAGLSDFEAFMNDFVKLNRPPTGGSPANKNSKGANSDKNGAQSESLASVEDYVNLLRKHAPALHRFLHQICKNGSNVPDMYREYAKQAATHFRPQQHGGKQQGSAQGDGKKNSPRRGAGTMTPQLEKLVADLAPEQREIVLQQLDAHFAFKMALEASSRDRMRSVLQNSNNSNSSSSSKSSRPASSSSASGAGGNNARASSRAATMYGPGMYLTRWQQLLDSTPISPRTARGPVRHGADRSVQQSAAVDVDGEPKARAAVPLDDMGLQPPDVDKVVALLAPRFARLMREAWRKGQEKRESGNG